VKCWPIVCIPPGKSPIIISQNRRDRIRVQRLREELDAGGIQGWSSSSRVSEVPNGRNSWKKSMRESNCGYRASFFSSPGIPIWMKTSDQR
jgi:hypothetical protein